MRTANTFTTAVVIAAVLSAVPSFADPASERENFQATLNKIADAEKKRDAATWTRLIRDASTPDCHYVSPNGKTVKMATAIQSMKDQFMGTRSVSVDTYTIKSYTPAGNKATAVVEYHAVAAIDATDESAGGKPKVSTVDSTLTLTFHLVKTPDRMKAASIDIGMGKIVIDGKTVNPVSDRATRG